MKVLYRIGLIACFLFNLSNSISAATYTLSGRVYAGNVGQTSNPLSGVSMYLWGANDPGSASGLPGGAVIIDSTLTDGNGWYGLGVDVNVYAFDLYFIQASRPCNVAG